MSAENSIAMVLLAARVAHAVGTRPNVEMDPEAISRAIGKAVKTVRNTLAMMTKTGLIDRTSDGTYKLSMQGIRKAHEIAKSLTARAASTPTEKPVTASG
jgi:DNA-binding IclR family transcriptional regulator